ncbi:MAG TPA: threonine synthase [Planctomycetales bacterium]|jgi:threonine synthase|nr:threonine synthase [Planctomycetales bacterium]
MKSFVTHLESALDGSRLPADEVHTVHQGRPLWVRYDLDAVRAAVTPEDVAQRGPSLWRYRELLPLPFDAEPVTLGEGMTPLLPCPRLGQALGLRRLFIKDESQLPTGSFKSRGMTTAVSMARHFGLRRLAIPTAGNAGGALAAYGARAGMEVFVFMPEDTPIINQMEAHLAGARVFLVNGLITDCGRLVREGTGRMGWFDVSTLKEPYRLEGKKTMGLELAEQMAWRLPDAIFYPTGGGTGLIGMSKAFQELRELGWLRTQTLPRMIACQSDGCAPIVRAFDAGARFAEPFPNAHTIASGLRVPAAVGDFMMLDAIRASGGCAIAGRENRILHWMRQAAGLEGISLCPEAAVCLDCLETLCAEGGIQPDEEVVVFNTGASQKYPEIVPLALPRLDKDRPIHYESLSEQALPV